MDCPYCQIAYDPDHWEQCPHCGEEDESREALKMSGVLRTSTILIAAGDARFEVYRSVEEVPEPLRRKLVECTNGQNSGTIYIADQRGKEQIALAIRSLPGTAAAPVLDRFSAAVAPASVCAKKKRLSLSALWIALMILASAAGVFWLAGGRAW